MAEAHGGGRMRRPSLQNTLTGLVAGLVVIAFGLGFFNPLSFAVAPVFVTALVVDVVLRHRDKISTDQALAGLRSELTVMAAKQDEHTRKLNDVQTAQIRFATQGARPQF